MTKQARRDRDDLLYLANLSRGHGRWCKWVWWRAHDLMPDPCDMPVGPGISFHSARAQIAESIAYSAGFWGKR